MEGTENGIMHVDAMNDHFTDDDDDDDADDDPGSGRTGHGSVTIP